MGFDKIEVPILRNVGIDVSIQVPNINTIMEEIKSNFPTSRIIYVTLPSTPTYLNSKNISHLPARLPTFYTQKLKIIEVR